MVWRWRWLAGGSARRHLRRRRRRLRRRVHVFRNGVEKPGNVAISLQEIER